MQAGKLRDRITIQRRPTTKDAAGQRSSPWEDVLARVASNVQNLSGRELANAQAVVAEATHLIVMRGYQDWFMDVRPDTRVLFGDRIFDVKYVTNPDGRDRELRILCAEIIG